jgi:DNA modification methylase
MKPVIEMNGARVFHGSNLDVLPTLPDNSVDSIVTDPPYELGFMGKSWDSTGIAYSVELWTECMRVLKPGGHLLAFGGSRTWHRLAVAIEDAGFEMRDSIAWLYGSGFPKSMDISKAIDKSDAGEARRKRDLSFVEWMKTTGLTAKQVNEIIGKADVGSHYFRLDQPAVATTELFDKLRPYLPEVPNFIEQMVAERTIESENFKKRQVIGSKIGTKSVDGGGHGIIPGGITEAVTLDITAPATPEAQKWQGWGTALKPAFEPVVVARKPFKGTVAGNVLEWGVGGLNIDGSRIGLETIPQYQRTVIGGKALGGKGVGIPQKTNGVTTFTTGRWPANIILDPYTAELLDEQSGVSKSPKAYKAEGYKDSSMFGIGGVNHDKEFGDTGGASRFFYVAKASKRDRNEGLEGLDAVRHSDRDKADGVGGDNPRNRTNEAKQNFHPTVKPTALMEYLIKLVTPEGGTVLDPFTGSGSTGKAALLNGFQFTGIELTEEYLPIIEGRLKWANEQREAQQTIDTIAQAGKLF